MRPLTEIGLYLVIHFGLATIFWWKMQGDPLTWAMCCNLMFAGVGVRNILDRVKTLCSR